MKFFSTNRNAPLVDFRDATISGQAPDKGLYFPSVIPALPVAFLDKIESLSKEEIAFEVIQPYVADSIPRKELMDIVAQTIAFDFPLKQVNENIFSWAYSCFQRCWRRFHESLFRSFCQNH